MNLDIKHLRWPVALALGLLAWPPGGVARAAAGTRDPARSSQAQAQAKLADVRAHIAALTGRLALELKERDSIGAKVREADLRITALRQRVEGLRTAKLAAERHRAALSADAVRTRGALEAERRELAAAVKSAYLLGRQEELRLLLSQADPGEAARMLTYYGYLARARGATIAAIQQKLAQLQGLVAQIEQTSATLESLETETRGEMAELQRARGERALALAGLARQVESANEKLAQLKREEQAVETLVADLSNVLRDFPIDSQQSFERLRGKLPWPVTGRLTARYQEPRAHAAPSSAVPPSSAPSSPAPPNSAPSSAAQGAVRWNGVMIETARGAKVRAPYFGRVVYADWLQGLGLLLIIAHSGNYMTLYGHAEVLYKSVGDWVAPGDVIAALADSGAAPPQLYFEIRDGRKTVDPLPWLTANP